MARFVYNTNTNVGGLIMNGIDVIEKITNTYLKSDTYSSTEINTRIATKEASFDVIAPLVKGINTTTGKFELKFNAGNLGDVSINNLTLTSNVISNGSANFKSAQGLKCNSIAASTTPHLSIFGSVIVYDNIEFRGSHNINPYWIAANINISGNVYSNKGQFNITSIVKQSTDTEYTITFPEHPEGSRYMILLGSTEFHTCYRNQTSTSFILCIRSSTNGQGTEGGGTFNIAILI